MTSPNVDADRLSLLLDLAIATGTPNSTDLTQAQLSEEETREVMRLKDLLDLIEASWRVASSTQDRVEELFLQKLAEQAPDHPLVRKSRVHTLGQLVQLDASEVPELPQVSYDQLAQDPTPVQSLLDPATRRAAVGEAIKRAAIPPLLIGEFVLWVNRTIGYLISPSDSAFQGLLFTRRQGHMHGNQGQTKRK